MAILKLLILAIAIYCSFTEAIRQTGVTRNTIFGDERTKGELFENVDVFETLQSRSDSPFRLPTTTRPEHYTITLTFNMVQLTYTGTVDINLYATESNVNEIVLHSDHNVITSVGLTQGSTIVPITYTTQTEGELLRVQLTSGSLEYNVNTNVIYTLTINYSGALRDDMRGLYKTWYRNSANDQERWMVTTQFAPTAARYAFPCYDEPSFKATFDVTISRPASFRSWFNTRLREIVVSDTTGYQNDIYYKTPIMSTYLVAIIVAEYDSLEIYSNSNLLMHEVIGRPGALSSRQGDYALATGPALLDAMSIETDYDYYTQHPDLKMTHASIPDFDFGAMENWGLVTYREAYLMYDEVHTNNHYKQIIAYILAHEIAHMWFGNLVTCQWWDAVWLNEGFARYYQYFLTDRVEDMGLATRFITEQVHSSLLSDSANSPHPLTNPGVATNAQVLSMFSSISYNKGASIIRQTEHLLGAEVHKQALRQYLKDFEFKAVRPSDLFRVLELTAQQTGALSAYGEDFDFVQYYSTWTDQPGHPVINVNIDHSTGQMIINQRRFNINTGYSAAGNNYVIPITFTTASNPDFKNTKPTHIISDTVSVINRGVLGDQWTVFNKQQTGFYRVNYDDYSWDLIIMALRGTDMNVIHEFNRAQIVNDAFSFARSGLMTYERMLNIVSYLRNEVAYTPWVAALSGFTWIRNRMHGNYEQNSLDSLIVEWATTLMNDLTYYPTAANESFMRSYLRYQMAPMMCTYGVNACITAALEQFSALRSSSATEVPADSRNWVYCNALRQGTVEDFNFLWNRYQQHNVYTEKLVILAALGCTPHAASLNTLLNNIVQDNFVIRPQDYTTAFSSAVNGNEVNTQIVFNYIQNNLQAVINAFGNAVTPLSFISSRLRTVAEIDEFQAWATTNQAVLGTDYNSVFNGAELSRESITWMNSIRDSFNSYISNGDQNYQITTAPPTTTTAESSTSPQPDLDEPVNPDIPTPDVDSAVSNVVSSVVIVIAAFANFVVY